MFVGSGAISRFLLVGARAPRQRALLLRPRHALPVLPPTTRVQVQTRVGEDQGGGKGQEEARGRRQGSTLVAKMTLRARAWFVREIRFVC